MKFEPGRLVQIGNSRWLEHQSTMHAGIVRENETVLVLSIVQRFWDKCIVIVFHGGVIGRMILYSWVDLILR